MNKSCNATYALTMTYSKGKMSFLFVLRNINTDKIDQKYGIVLKSNIADNHEVPLNVTKLSDILPTRAVSKDVTFMDETKNLHKCDISMIDFKSNVDINAYSYGYNCFWCKNKFETMPIGCPIRFISSMVTKTYTSEISKDVYTIKENISEKKLKAIEASGADLKIMNKNYYITDGIFCSFSCAAAYIADNNHNRMYNDSSMLLTRIYNDILKPTTLQTISPAPHWRLLKEYGGHLSIKEFRETFGKVDFECHGIINQFKPISILFEKKIKF